MNTNAIAQNLKLLRELRGLSQKDVANALGIERTTYVKWESGTSKPLRKLKDIADFFGVSVDYLLGLPANATVRTSPQETEGLQSFLQEAAEIDNTEYALKDTIEIKIQMELAKLLRSSDDDTKQAIYEYLTTAPETKKALASVIAMIRNKK